MHTSLGTRCTGVSTPLDETFYPSISFGPGGAEGEVTLLLTDKRYFVLRFGNVETVCGYSETVYWTLAEEPSRPYHILNLIQRSPLVERIIPFRPVSSLSHFLVCGAQMCVEIVAADAYDLREYSTQALAEYELALELEGKRPHGQSPKWRDPNVPWINAE
jgi:hypothetical protein